MPARKPKVGDPVSHDSQYDWEITRLVPHAYLDEAGDPQKTILCVFENERKAVKCLGGELVWLEEDGAWMLPGRLLSRDHRAHWRKIMGMSMGPPAEMHVEARLILRHHKVEV